MPAATADEAPASRCLTRPGQGPEMAVIESGRFVMGSSPETDSERSEDEGPQHGVAVVKPFALGRCEVTVGEFRAFVDDTRYVTAAEKGEGCWYWDESAEEAKQGRGRDWRSPGFPQGQDHPVVCVSWNDAQAYATWLSARTGRRYRLPTEAEWEYAARAGTESSRFWSNDPDSACGFANVYDKAGEARWAFGWEVHGCDDGQAATSPVAAYEPNGFELYDVLGNVWERTADCWHESYKGAPVDGTGWKEGGDCDRRVVRGGSWSGKPGSVRSANRNRFNSGGANDYVGFRLARDI